MTIINFSKLLWQSNATIEELENNMNDDFQKLQNVLAEIEEKTSKITAEDDSLTNIDEELKQVATDCQLLSDEEQKQISEILLKYYQHYNAETIKKLEESEKIKLVMAILKAENYVNYVVQRPGINTSELLRGSLGTFVVGLEALLLSEISKCTPPLVELSDDEISSFKSFVFDFIIANKGSITKMLGKAQKGKEEQIEFEDVYQILTTGPNLKENETKIVEIFNQYSNVSPDWITEDEKKFVNTLYKAEKNYNSLYQQLAASYPDKVHSLMDRYEAIELMQQWCTKFPSHITKDDKEKESYNQLLNFANVVIEKLTEILKNSRLPLSDSEIKPLRDSVKDKLIIQILLRAVNCKALDEVLMRAIPSIYEGTQKENMPATLAKYNHSLTKNEIVGLDRSKKEALAKDILHSARFVGKLTEDDKEKLESYLKQQKTAREAITASLKMMLSTDLSREDIIFIEGLSEEDQTALLYQILSKVIKTRELLDKKAMSTLWSYSNKYMEKEMGGYQKGEDKKKLKELKDQKKSAENRKRNLYRKIEELTTKETFARGHLIKSLQQFIVKKRSLGIDTTEDEKLLQEQVKFHKEQITKRLSESKQSPNHKISFEVGLKYEMLIAAYSKLKASTKDNRQETIRESIKDTISVIESIVKAPAIGFTKAIGEGTLVVATALVLPSYVRARLSPIANPKSPYANRKIRDMSAELAANIIRKMGEYEANIRRR